MTSTTAGIRRVGTWLQARLSGVGPATRHKTPGRWLRVGLTVTLLAAGMAAWAVALIQPWKAQAADPGFVAVPGQPAPQRVRAAAAEAEHLADPVPVPALPVLARNPFEAPGWAGGSEGEARAGDAAPDAARPPSPSEETGLTARQVAEAVRGLTLKATVRSSRGERWVVINEKVYREGDEVAGLALVEIGDNRATLRGAGVTCVLRMD